MVLTLCICLLIIWYILLWIIYFFSLNMFVFSYCFAEILYIFKIQVLCKICVFLTSFPDLHFLSLHCVFWWKEILNSNDRECMKHVLFLNSFLFKKYLPMPTHEDIFLYYLLKSFSFSLLNSDCLLCTKIPTWDYFSPFLFTNPLKTQMKTIKPLLNL